LIKLGAYRLLQLKNLCLYIRVYFAGPPPIFFLAPPLNGFSPHDVVVIRFQYFISACIQSSHDC